MQSAVLNIGFEDAPDSEIGKLATSIVDIGTEIDDLSTAIVNIEYETGNLTAAIANIGNTETPGSVISNLNNTLSAKIGSSSKRELLI